MLLPLDKLKTLREALLMYSFRKARASKNCPDQFKKELEEKAKDCLAMKDRVEELINKDNGESWLVFIENGRELLTPLKETKEGLCRSDYHKAIGILDASNISGIVNSFKEMLIKIRNEAAKKPETNNPEWINTHPITILYIYKISELAGLFPDHESFNKAYSICKDKAYGSN